MYSNEYQIEKEFLLWQNMLFLTLVMEKYL